MRIESVAVGVGLEKAIQRKQGKIGEHAIYNQIGNGL
jgi:hypothetical protein